MGGGYKLRGPKVFQSLRIHLGKPVFFLKQFQECFGFLNEGIVVKKKLVGRKIINGEGYWK
jgi:hypothetical protein